MRVHVGEAGTGWAGDVLRAREQPSWVAWPYKRVVKNISKLKVGFHLKGGKTRSQSQQWVKDRKPKVESAFSPAQYFSHDFYVKIGVRGGDILYFCKVNCSLVG